MTILEAMRSRRSVRTYNRAPLDQNQIELLTRCVASAQSPFGGRVAIRLRLFNVAAGYKPSTYGMIKGASDYFLVAFAKGDRCSELTAGYRFEQVVLKAWQMGLGTCWIAATFKQTVFEEGVRWPDGLSLQIVSPVGVAAKERSLLERVSRSVVGSDRRKPFGKLFFESDFSTPLSSESRFGESLEMMRLAPSSTNSQPWRAVVEGDTVHFYYVDKSKLAMIDCGIGLCHFHLTEQYRQSDGRFEECAQHPAAPKGVKYLISYKANAV